MHTEVSSPSAPIHRHFVVGPVFFVAFLLLTTLASGMRVFTAQVATSLAATGSLDVGPVQPFSYGDFVGVSGDRGAAFSFFGPVSRLVEGDALIAATGVTRVSVGQWTLSTLGGSVYVSVHDGALTVAGITAPALLRTEDGDAVLVPSGMEWQSDAVDAHALSPVSPVFLAQEQSLSVADASGSSLPQAVADEPSQTSWSLQLLLPDAQKRLEDEFTHAVFGHVRSLVESGDVSALRAYLTREEVLAVFRSSHDTERIVSTLLWRGPEGVSASTRQVLLPLLASDADVTLLASVHPELRIAVAAPLSDEDERLLLLTLPFGDTLPEALPAAAVDAWQKGVERQLAIERDPAATLSALLRGARVLMEMFRADQFPERESRYATAYDALLLPYAASLSDDDRAFVSSLKPSVMGMFATNDNAASQDVFEGVSRTLRDAGAAFSVGTNINPTGAHTAHIDDVIFGTSHFSFDFDLRIKQVKNVVRDGKKLPYPMPFVKFVEWSKAGD